jgi:hypothetical protein
MDLDTPSPTGTDAAEEAVRRGSRLPAAFLLAVIVTALVFAWGSVAGALDQSSSSERDRAAEQIETDAGSLDRAATLLDEADDVAGLRAAGARVAALRLGLDDQRRELAQIEDQEIADVALRVHRAIEAVLDGWAALELLEDRDPAAWSARESGPVLESTNLLRDGLVSEARRRIGRASIDHSRARAVTLKVARSLVKAADRR